MSYFTGIDTVGAVKSLYRKLAKQHHPDLGGNTAKMQEINAAYHAKLESLHGQTVVGSDHKKHTYYYKQEVEQEIMDKIYELLAMKLPGVEIELVGTWVWVSGNTKPVKEHLKSAGLVWHGKRRRWYWRRFTRRRKYRGVSMDALRAAYGSETFDPDEGTGLAVA